MPSRAACGSRAVVWPPLCYTILKTRTSLQENDPEAYLYFPWIAAIGTTIGRRRVHPFNDHQSHCNGSCIFGYNSAPAAAREVFKPSTDSASLVVLSQKKFFSLGLGVLLGGRHKWGWVRGFLAYIPGPKRQSNGPTFSIKYFYETRKSHESLESSIAFLAHLDQNLYHKNQKLLKISTPKKLRKGKITPLLDMAITRH